LLDLATTETEPALREFVGTTRAGKTERQKHTAFIVHVGHPCDVILALSVGWGLL
jgi:hypothetical protein